MVRSESSECLRCLFYFDGCILTLPVFPCYVTLTLPWKRLQIRFTGIKLVSSDTTLRQGRSLLWWWPSPPFLLVWAELLTVSFERWSGNTHRAVLSLVTHSTHPEASVGWFLSRHIKQHVHRFIHSEVCGEQVPSFLRCLAERYNFALLQICVLYSILHSFKYCSIFWGNLQELVGEDV